MERQTTRYFQIHFLSYRKSVAVRKVVKTHKFYSRLTNFLDFTKKKTLVDILFHTNRNFSNFLYGFTLHEGLFYVPLSNMLQWCGSHITRLDRIQSRFVGLLGLKWAWSILKLLLAIFDENARSSTPQYSSQHIWLSFPS